MKIENIEKAQMIMYQIQNLQEALDVLSCRKVQVFLNISGVEDSGYFSKIVHNSNYELSPKYFNFIKEDILSQIDSLKKELETL